MATPTPILFLHGFLGCKEDWSPFCRNNDITVDLPGHGGTNALNLAATAARLAALLDQRQLAKVALVGYSLGGRIALAFASRYPERIDTLILESAHPGIEAQQQRQQRVIADNTRASELENCKSSDTFRAFLDDWYHMPMFHNITTAPNYPELYARRCNNDVDALAAALRLSGTGTMTPYWKFLKSSPFPTTYIYGQADTRYHDIATRIANLNPSIDIHGIPDCGHCVHVEAAEIFRSLLP